VAEGDWWLSTGDAADRLGIDTHRVHQLIEEGRLGSRRARRIRGGAPPRGWRVEVNADDVRRFLDDEGDDGLAGVPSKV
jgi:hypothetical protein